MEIRRVGDGANEVFQVADAEDNGNYVREDGAIGYKVFLTDFEILDDEPLLDQVFLENLPPDATLITLDLARFEDPDDPTPVAEYPNLSAGEPIVFTNDERGPDVVGAKVTIATADGTTTDFNVNPAATGEVLYADDTAASVDVTIESDAGLQFSGVVAARVR